MAAQHPSSDSASAATAFHVTPCLLGGFVSKHACFMRSARVPQQVPPCLASSCGDSRPACLAWLTCYQVAVLQEYWDVYDSHPHVQGGFIWDWVDQVHNSLVSYYTVILF